MTLYEFTQLNNLDQVNAIINFGLPVLETSNGINIIELFQLDDFYVEVKRNTADVITGITPFDYSSIMLNYYIYDIDISTLITQ